MINGKDELLRGFRNFVRRALPRQVLNLIGNILIKRRVRRLGQMSVSDAFDEIYRKKMWMQGNSLSGAGSEGKWAEDYASFVSSYIRVNGCRTILDLGCGDFLVGQRISPGVETYLAGDISKTIIEINRAKFGHLTNVRFQIINVLEDTLPNSDLILIRQVFQHLSNAQIETALRNIERQRPARVLIAEHVYRPELMIEPNLELGAHSVMTRVAFNSGVDIAKLPFLRDCRVVAILEPGPENLAEFNSVLCIYEMRFDE